MKCILMIILSCACFCASSAQSFSGEYTTELQWDMKKETNWVNLLRLNLSVPLFDGKGSLEAATIHSAKTNNRPFLPRNGMFGRSHMGKAYQPLAFGAACFSVHH